MVVVGNLGYGDACGVVSRVMELGQVRYAKDPLTSTQPNHPDPPPSPVEHQKYLCSLNPPKITKTSKTP